MYGRIVKSERILTKLCVLDYEYICDRTAKFRKKILFITRVINIQILTTKYFSFQYSVTYAVRHSGVWKWRCVDAMNVNGWCAQNSCWNDIRNILSTIWFSDEKVFTDASPTNLQNDRVYAVSGTKKKQLPVERLLRKRSTFSQSVMMSVVVNTLGRTDLFFVDPWTKVNGQYYRDILLRQQLPAICGLSGDFFTFQQDNAPAHRARERVHLLTHETPDFITPALWPANSPDLTPSTTRFWGSWRSVRVYRSQIRHVDQLKSRLIEEREHFHQVVIDEAVRQWRSRLRACVRANGGHFEHRL